jgi:hypothetical protein
MNEHGALDPVEAFEALADETRLDIRRALADRRRDARPAHADDRSVHLVGRLADLPGDVGVERAPLGRVGEFEPEFGVGSDVADIGLRALADPFESERRFAVEPAPFAGEVGIR